MNGTADMCEQHKLYDCTHIKVLDKHLKCFMPEVAFQWSRDFLYSPSAATLRSSISPCAVESASAAAAK